MSFKAFSEAASPRRHRPCDARADFADALSLAVVGNAACDIGRSPITTFSKMQDA